jgi:phosphopantetheine binding protein
MPNEPAAGTPSRSDYADTASWIAALWSTLLERPVGVEENFFDVGGDSLLALEAAAQLQEDGYPDIPISAVLRWPTAAEFAANLR